MVSRNFRIRFLSDVILNASNKTEGGNLSLDYIPGAKFLGMIAQHLYAQLQAQNREENILDIFHNGTVRFGDGSLILNEDQLRMSGIKSKSFRIPLSWYKPKGEMNVNGATIGNQFGIKEYHLLNSSDFENWQPKQIRAGYLSLSGAYFPDELEAQFQLKTAYDKERRTALKGRMFGVQAIPAGYNWIFTVTDTSENYIEQITELLKGVRYLGKSISAQFGRIEITPLGKEYDIIKEAGEIHIGKAENAFIYAASNWVLPGAVNNLLEFLQAERVLGTAVDAELLVDKSSIRTSVYQSWNGHRNTRNPDRLMVERGSVLVYKFKSECTRDAIGWYGTSLNEGFGEFFINPPFLNFQESELFVPNKIEREHLLKDSLMRPDINQSYGQSNTKLIHAVKAKIKHKKMNAAVWQIVNQFTNNKEYRFAGISASQWGAVRGIAEGAKTQNDLLDNLSELVMGIRQDVWRKNKNLDKLKKVICTLHKELTNEHGFRGVKSALINFCAEKAKAVNKHKQN